MKPLLFAGLLLALAAPAAAQDVKISRADGTEVTLSAAALADLPRAQVTVPGDAGPSLYEGPPLAYVMRAAGLSQWRLARPANRAAKVISAHRPMLTKAIWRTS